MAVIATILTCYNRREKTLACLKSLFEADLPAEYCIETFLTDDGSTDGTSEAIKIQFPRVTILPGTGNLFWAGGMRLAWSEALKATFDGFLLLNDDTILKRDSLKQLIEAHNYSLIKNKIGGIYVGTTYDPTTKCYTYGGSRLFNSLTGKSRIVEPDNKTFQSCDFANGNILFVSKNVVESIGILSEKFTHLLADYDYTLKAKKRGFPLLVCAGFCGTCENDHSKTWLSKDYSLAERIKYLKSPKHLAYYEYLYFIRVHFPFFLPVSFVKLWIKTLFPTLYDKFKK